MTTTDTTWIVPGAEVVLYSESAEHTDVDVRMATVASVARGVFTVDVPGEPRFSVHFPEAETDGRYIRYVVARDSERGRKLARKATGRDRQARRQGAASAAHRAVTHWVDGDRLDRDHVEAAIDALTALRGTL